MKQNRQSRIVAILVLFVSAVGLTLGFAAFSNTLTISSSATVKPDQQDFKLVAYGYAYGESGCYIPTDPACYKNSTSIPPGTEEPGEDAVISSSLTGSGSNKITISNLKANMTEPGDTVSYWFMIKNEGEYDAYLLQSALDKYININEQTVCKAIADEDGGTATESLVTEACKQFDIHIIVFGDEELNKVLESTGSNYEYIKIPKYGSSFNDTNYGYAIFLVELKYNGPTRVDGDFTVEFADIELEFTTTPPTA